MGSFRRLPILALVVVALIFVAGRAGVGGLRLPDRGDLPGSDRTAGDTGSRHDTPTDTAAIAAAKATLPSIQVKGRGPKTGYSRDQFGPAWADEDHNGCDTRNDMLAHDLTGETFKPGTRRCVVITGVLNDPYTGRRIEFVKAKASAVQVDHIYPLSLAWQQGAAGWTPEKRRAFANDQKVNLQVTDGPTNGAKGDSGPGSWLPPDKGYRCVYVARFTLSAAAYQLSMNPGDKAMVVKILNGC